MKSQLASILFLITTTSTPAMAQHLVNTTSEGLALEGYDPVAFFADKKATPGRLEYEATYQGATYRFASRDHQRKFRADPERFAPQYGGFCAYAASFGKLAPVQIRTWSVVDGKQITVVDNRGDDPNEDQPRWGASVAVVGEDGNVWIAPESPNGFVRGDHILGRPLAVFWPWDRIGFIR
jgi:YHS domain-containing protein